MKLEAKQQDQARDVQQHRDALAQITAGVQERRDTIARARAARLEALLAHARIVCRPSVSFRGCSRPALARRSASAGPGGPWAIPWPIVQCESGGQNLPPNTAGASGYYQMLPSTWKGLGGSTPAAYQASKAEQDRLAARLWAGRRGALELGAPGRGVGTGLTASTPSDRRVKSRRAHGETAAADRDLTREQTLCSQFRPALINTVATSPTPYEDPKYTTSGNGRARRQPQRQRGHRSHAHEVQPDLLEPQVRHDRRGHHAAFASTQTDRGRQHAHRRTAPGRTAAPRRSPRTPTKNTNARADRPGTR